MYVRFTFITGERLDLDTAVDYIESTARPQVEAAEGNRGFVTCTGEAPRSVVVASYWDGAQAMAASGAALGALREQSATAAGGRFSVEEYQVAIGFRRSIPARDATVRLARLQVDPSEVAAMVEFYDDETVPRVTGATGLCSFQLLVDPESGTGMAVTAWENEQVLREFWPTAELIRVRTTRKAGVAFGAVETYRLVRSSLRLEGLVPTGPAR